MRVKITHTQAEALINAIAVEAEEVKLEDVAEALKGLSDSPRSVVELAQIIRESVMSMEAARRGKA
jgi:hypothetical protein